MQIRNDYNSFSHKGYEEDHAHHITKCLHEESHKRQEGAAAGIKKKAFSSMGKKEEGQDYMRGSIHSTGSRTGGLKKGPGLFKNFWDSMGDDNEKGDKENGPEKLFAMGREQAGSGIEAASSLIRHGIPHWVAGKWENVREKIKTGLSAALKRFGRDKEAFSTLADPKGHFAGKKQTGGDNPEKTGKGTRLEEAEIPAAFRSDSHLMDSYSKTGEYCRLNENLVYPKVKKQSQGSEATGLGAVPK